MKRARDPLLIGGTIVLLGLACLAAVESIGWVGRAFPGFLVLENRIVASAGLAHWPAVRNGEIFQHEVVSVDGDPLRDPRDLAARVESRPVGTRFTYRVRRGGHERVVEVESRRFTRMDFTLLFGTYLFCGVGIFVMALAIRYLGRRDRVADGSALALGIIGIWALTAVDIYGPYRIFRLHALAECLLFAGTLHLALVFPQPRGLVQRMPRLPLLLYVVAAGLGLASQITLMDPAAYVMSHRIAVAAFGASLLVLLGAQVMSYLRPRSFEERQRVKILVVGMVAALTPQAILTLGSAVSGGQAPENVMGWSGVFFPLAIAYAVLHQDLLRVDALLRRSLNYALLTATVALTYATGVIALESALHTADTRFRWAAVALFSGVAVLVLLPLRDRLQSLVDRVFFRTAYDFRRLVETTSAHLASATQLDVISHEVRRAVEEALHPEAVVFCVREPDAREVDPAKTTGVTGISAAILGEARQTTAPVDFGPGLLLVPFCLEGRLVACLLLGRRLSGAFYSGDDRKLLQTLANQGALAVENALALVEVQNLNEDLEQKVEIRTAELSGALHELRQTQSQLVEQEKMASLGRLVAGVAHEINNPLNFVQGNLHYLEEYSRALAGAVDACQGAIQEAPSDPAVAIDVIREKFDLDYRMQDLDSVLAACREGLDRTLDIVKDLRTFSRVDRGAPGPVDLVEALGSTLNLLSGRLQGLRVVRDLQPLPAVECLAGPVNQVFMNLIANAADAVGESGCITIRTRPIEGGVAVEVEDDGCGISEEHLPKVFEPFFTTKEVGVGTGLGLALSYGVVKRHGGEIQVTSEVGRGSCFRVELPLQFSGADAAASAVG